MKLELEDEEVKQLLTKDFGWESQRKSLELAEKALESRLIKAAAETLASGVGEDIFKQVTENFLAKALSQNFIFEVGKIITKQYEDKIKEYISTPEAQGILDRRAKEAVIHYISQCKFYVTAPPKGHS